MKTYKQFQQNIQEIDQNLMGPGLGAISAVGNALSFVGKQAARAGATGIARNIGGSSIQDKRKFKGPGGDPSGSGLGQAQQRRFKGPGGDPSGSGFGQAQQKSK